MSGVPPAPKAMAVDGDGDEHPLTATFDGGIGDEEYDSIIPSSVPPVPLPEAASAAMLSFPSWTDEQQTFFVWSLLGEMKLKDLVSISTALIPLTRRDFLTQLPGELAEKILSYLDEKELGICEQVCKSWQQVVNDNVLWKRLFAYRKMTDSAWELLDSYHRAHNTILPSKWKRRFRIFKLDLLRVDENWRMGNHDPEVIECNGNGIYCLQYDMEKVVSGSRDNTIKIWDMKSRVCHRVMEGHTGSVLCLQFDDTKVVSGSSDATVRVWDIKTGECKQVISDHSQSVLHLRFDKTRLVTCSKDHTVRLWTIGADGMSFRPQFQLTGHRAAVNVVEFDDTYIVSASGDRTIRIWSTANGTLLNTLKGHSRGIACLQFRNGYIVSGSSDETIRVWQVSTGLCLRTLRGHSGLVRCLRFDEKYIISGSYDCTIRIWNFETGEQMHTLYGHTNRVFRVQFDRFKIISSSQDDRILIWDFYEHGRKAAHEQQLMLEHDAQDGGAAAAAGDGDDGRFDRPAMMSGML